MSTPQQPPAPELALPADEADSSGDVSGSFRVNSEVVPIVLESSLLIETREDARRYYLRRLARRHSLVVRERPVSIVFEREGTHLYSQGPEDGISEDEIEPDLLVTRSIPSKPPRVERRRFSIDRARLMDEALRAVTQYTRAVKGLNERIVLYGRRLDCGRYMKVVLRPGPKTAFTCVSAFPVVQDKWLATLRERPVPFPPELPQKR